MSSKKKKDTSKREKFTILFVDDKPEYISQDIKDLRDYLVEVQLDLVDHYDKTGEKVEEILVKNQVDIVVTDLNISDKISGVGVVEIVKLSGMLIDILFYSGAGFDDDGKIKGMVDDYRSIEFCDSNDIFVPLKRMIEKNIARTKDIVYLRGIILSAVIELDLIINEIIVKYFKIPPSRKEDFHAYVLENTNYSFEGKIRTIFNILEVLNKNSASSNKKYEYPGLRSKLRDVQEYRNYVAHCKRDPQDRDYLISMGSRKIFNRAKLKSLLKNTTDAIKLLNEFSNDLTS